MSLSESRLSLTALAKRENVNIATIWRWTMKGVRGAKLATLVIGGRRYVTDEQWAAFVAALNGDQAPAAKPTTNRQREKQIAAAEAELARAGI